MRWTKRHFEDIADIIRKTREYGSCDEHTLEMLELELIHFFEDQNPMFDARKFLARIANERKTNEQN